MAVTAKFQADFSSFIDAIDKAEVALVDFSKGANKVESSLNRMVDNFSGRKLIQEASLMTIAIEKAGGISTLTAKELAAVGAKANEAADKMARLGYEVPAGLQKLADATKQNETAASGWSSALSGASKVLGALGIGLSVGAIVNFGKALLDDADALTKMHDKTGISVEGLQAMRAAGDDAGVGLDAMTASVNMLQKRLGGDDESANKALRDLGINIEAFKQLDGSQQMDALSNAIRGIDDPLRVANDLSALFGKQWAEQLPVLKRGFQELHDGSVQMSAGTVKALDDAGDAMGRFWRSTKANLGEALADVLTLSLSSTRALNAEIAKLPTVIKPDEMKNLWGAIVPPGLPKDLKAIEDGFRADADAIKQMGEMTKVMGEIEKTTFGLAMDHQKQWRDEIEKTKDARNRTVTEGLSEIQKAEKDLADFQAKQALDTLSYQVLKIWERVDEEERAFKGSEQQRAAFNKAVEALAVEEAQALTDASDKAIIAAAKVAAATEQSASRQVTALDKATEGYYREIDAAMALLALTGMDSSSGSRVSTPNDGSQARGPGVNQAFTVPINGVTSAVAFKIPSHKYGGPTVEGPAYLHNDEYVVPKNGALVMSGGGGATVVNIYVTQPLGSPSAIAAAIDQALTARQLNLGTRFPARI